MSEFEILIITKIPEKRRGFRYIPIEQFMLEETEGKAKPPKRETKVTKDGDSA